MIEESGLVCQECGEILQDAPIICIQCLKDKFSGDSQKLETKYRILGTSLKYYSTELELFGDSGTEIDGRLSSRDTLVMYGKEEQEEAFRIITTLRSRVIQLEEERSRLRNAKNELEKKHGRAEAEYIALHIKYRDLQIENTRLALELDRARVSEKEPPVDTRLFFRKGIDVLKTMIKKKRD